MSLEVIIYILVVHWFGDFIVQTHKQSSNKWHDMRQLTYHVLTYSAVWFVSLLFVGLGIEDILKMTFFIGVIHWATDAFTSQFTHMFAEKAKEDESYWHWFFVVVGIDQLLHYLQLIFIFKIYWV